MAEIYKEFQSASDYFHDSIPFIMEGQVVDTADPDQMGRVKVWITSLDGEDFDIDNIPWAEYASPFAGFTVEYPAGENQTPNHSHAAYGFWAIPKIGATVLVFCLNGSPSSRFFFASTIRMHRNRSLPAGRNTDFNGKQGPWGDAGDGTGNLNPIQPAFANLQTQFQGKTTQSEAITRGAYERTVAQAGNKDGKEGYSPNAADPSYLDPQTYCLVTPGRHALIMQDDPHFSRLRMKTAEGHQIIFDDANERIYMSTSKGNTWVEMDQDGHINIYGSKSISIRSGADINMYADGNINMDAGEGINMIAQGGDIRMQTSQNYQVQADKNIVQSACGIFDMGADKSMHLTAGEKIDIHAMQELTQTGNAGVDLKSGAGFKIQGDKSVDVKGGAVKVGGTTVDVGASSATTISGSPLNLNGPMAAPPASANAASDASCPELPASPSVVPGFEPWTRPVTTTGRGPFWKP